MKSNQLNISPAISRKPLAITLPAFTLIELLIVMAILGILTTLGISNFQSARVKARDAARKSDLQTIAKSLEAYANDYSGYPLSDAGSITDYPWGDPFVDSKGTIYAATLPEDSSANRSYYYESDGTSYSLYAALENENDLSIDTYTNTNCGTTTTIECNYRVTSSNIQ